MRHADVLLDFYASPESWLHGARAHAGIPHPRVGGAHQRVEKKNGKGLLGGGTSVDIPQRAPQTQSMRNRLQVGTKIKRVRVPTF